MYTNKELRTLMDSIIIIIVSPLGGGLFPSPLPFPPSLIELTKKDYAAFNKICISD